MNCSDIRDLIDVADSPAASPFELASHIESCSGCNSFRQQRVALRELLTSPARVSAPPDFDLVLKRQLRERLDSGRRSRLFEWLPGLTRPVYLKAAVAALAILLATTAGYLYHSKQVVPPSTLTAVNGGPVVPPPAPIARPSAPQPGPTAGTPELSGLRQVIPVRYRRRTRRMAGDSTLAREIDPMPVSDPLGQAVELFLIRNSNSEREVAVPAVSVGKQPLFYVSAQRSPDEGRRVSF
ncbi:MAG TPA: hypothetical protein VJX67_12230 [Blastocatellia bacterium]|nr:hypothetical protein [Blastocatellia bacterium]